jgi:hypothetical protein
MQVLAIGNSFSQDATAYLKKISEFGKGDITVVNLVIGGCSLSRHYRNMLSGEKAYSMEFNGQATGFYVSLDEALLSRDWDVVTIQQASHFSFKEESYQPYLDSLADYIRECCPQAKLYLHETWAYEEGSERLFKVAKYETRNAMYNDLHAAYLKAAEDIKADGFIPSGTLMQKLIENGVTRLHRDSFHASYDIGRYALALLWFKKLTGKSVLDNGFRCHMGEISDEEYAIIKKCVEEI